MTFTESLPPDLAPAFLAVPKPVQARWQALRALILEAARATNTAPLSEGLKWGQPAFWPHRRDGTTIRLGWSPKMPNHVAVLVHCQTDLVASWRQLFPDTFVYENNRAALIPLDGPLNGAELRIMLGMALTYHRDKRAS